LRVLRGGCAGKREESENENVVWVATLRPNQTEEALLSSVRPRTEAGVGAMPRRWCGWCAVGGSDALVI
jgi:hypothetical protein